MSFKLKTARKFTTRFKKMAFGGDPEGEILSHESHYDTNGNLVEEVKHDTDSGKPERNFYTYDPQNRLMIHMLTIEHEGVSETFRFDRDEKGRVICELKLYGDDPGEKSLYTYAAHEHPVKIEKFDADGEPETVEIVTYNEKDFPTEIVRLNPEGKTEEKTLLEYNSDSKPVKRTSYNESGELTKETVFLYNDKGELSRVTDKNAKGIITSDIINTYDERGNVTERKIRDFHSRILQFSYDERDNCIEENMLDEHGNLLMKNTFEFDEHNNLLGESGYYMDLNRSQDRSNSMARYEYEMFD